jgi:outer membrane protein assembly factor BamB
MIKYSVAALAATQLACIFPTEGSAGMELDTAGRLVVSRVWTNELFVLDPLTGEKLDTLRDGVTSPDDVTGDASGTLFYTSPFIGEVRSYRAAEGSKVVGKVQGANAITFDQKGRLFVAACFTGEDLYEVDPTGATPPRLVVEGPGRDCAMNGMVAGSDGRLYGAQPTLGRLVAFDPDTGALEVLADGLGGRGYGVAFLSDGTLLALKGEEVVEVDRARRTFSTWAKLPFDGDNLLPWTGGEVFVSSPTTGEVIAVKKGGEGRTLLEGSAGRSFEASP